MTVGDNAADIDAVQALARKTYDACHPDDSFDDLMNRAAFSKEDRFMLRDWLAAAARQLAGMPPPPPTQGYGRQYG